MNSKASSLAILSALFLAACSDFKVEDVAANRSLVLIDAEPAGENCAEGGKRVVSGIDVNLDGALDGEEIVNVSYVCAGEAGQSALVDVVDVPAGEVCQFGGQIVHSGLDLNGDGLLSEGEITESYTLCSGTLPQSGGSIAEIATFLNQSCALLSNQTVQCWGRAADGTDASPAPMVVPGIAKATDLAAGCALSEDGLVRCWSGLNASPRAVPNLSGVKAIAGADTHHKCALMEDGGVMCWGRNDAGQLGTGNYVDTTEPLPVLDSDGAPLKGAAAIAVGLYHTCAVLTDGSAACWGFNGHGQLGASGDRQFSSRALKVKLEEEGGDLVDVAQIALGYGHTCALLNDKSVKCWGSNEVGQLGQAGDSLSSSHPVTVPVGDSFEATSIAAGYGHTCAIGAAGNVRCWGWNVYGQLGSAAAGRASASPVDVEGLSGVASLALGEAHSCALIEGGAAKCWGNNSLGQFGNGVEAVNEGYVLTPSAVVELEGAVSVSSGYLFSCALLGDDTTQDAVSDARAKCWGNNEFHQLGNGDITSSQRFPTAVEQADGTPFSSIDELSLGYTHACALSEDKTAWCWGDNGMGQLGTGDYDSRSAPVRVESLSVVSSLASGHAHSCAVTGARTVMCWGYNEFGQLGDGTFGNSARPQMVSGLTDVKALALGRAHSCALLTDATVMCWGNDAYGQLGDGGGEESESSQMVPVKVDGLSNVAQIASGHAHVCALLTDGSVTCWGSNLLGEAGAPIDAATTRMAPSKVALAGKATAIASGYQHTCAILEDKTAACWGNNAYGQLGNAKLENSGTPVAVSGLTDVTSISTGHGHTCAAIADGTVKCWGNDRYGQLGQVNGNPRPVDAVFLQ